MKALWQDIPIMFEPPEFLQFFLLSRVWISGNSYKLVQQKAVCYSDYFIKAWNFGTNPTPTYQQMEEVL